MTRFMSPEFIAALTAPDVNLALFYEGEFATGTLRLWSGAGDIEAFRTWQPAASVRNLCAASEFPNGVTDASPRSSLITSAAMPGFQGALAFGYTGTSNQFAYRTGVVTFGQTYTISVFVRMDDGEPPRFEGAGATSSANDFAILFGGNALSGGNMRVTDLGDGLFRVSATRIISSTTNTNAGVLKYSTNSVRTFRVSGYQIEIGTEATEYQRVDPAGQAYDLRGPVFFGAGDLLGVGDIDESRDVVASGTTVSLSGVPTDLQALAIAQAQQGAPGRVYLGLFRLTPGGARMIGDPVILFSGLLNIPRMQGLLSSRINIDYDNRLVDLLRPRELRYNDQTQKSLYPGDRAFEYVTVIQQRTGWVR